jgi:2,3-bisphosphoglycerate-independent phosphoglycerate mutase
MAAGQRAAEVVDGCLRELLFAVDDVGGNALITADHGNLEKMAEVDKAGNELPFTQHTTNPVEVVIYGREYALAALREGGALCDIAPTLLQMMKLPKPDDMTGVSLIERMN